MEQVNDVLIALYRAAREVPAEEFHGHALALLSSAVPFDSARWATGAPDGYVTLIRGAFLFNESPETLTEYNEFREDDKALRLLKERPGLTLNCHLPTIIDTASHGLQSYLRRYQHEHALITACPIRETDTVQALSLYGAYENKRFSEQQRQLVQLVFPHLLEAMQINYALHIEREKSAGAGRAWAAAICDESGCFRFVEAKFAELLKAEWPNGNGRSVPAVLLAAVSDGAARLAGRYAVFVWRISRELMFIKARKRLPVDALSARELTVAQHVAAGWIHKEIARALNISPATVRNHVQAIHERIGVHNNAELVAQLKDAGF